MNTHCISQTVYRGVGVATLRFALHLALQREMVILVQMLGVWCTKRQTRMNGSGISELSDTTRIFALCCSVTHICSRWIRSMINIC
jgi:hypothetical protein